MKYIKQFESNLYNQKIYWLVPTDKRLKKSLTQINCPKDIIDNYINNVLPKLENNNYLGSYIFITYRPEYEPLIRWGWDYYHNTLPDEWLSKNNFVFGGTINIEQFELDANKFNL